MNWMEVALLLLGVGAFAASFIIPEKKGTKDGELEIDTELIKQIIERESNIAKKRVTEVVDETLMYAVEKAERTAERVSNEKIMAISEYSETVLADMNKAHQEVMFLYDMLNDKHKNLKETVKIVDKQAKVVEEKANAAATALAAKEEASAIIEKQIQGQVAQASEKPAKEAEQRITLDMIDMLAGAKQTAKTAQPMQTAKTATAVPTAKTVTQTTQTAPAARTAANASVTAQAMASMKATAAAAAQGTAARRMPTTTAPSPAKTPADAVNTVLQQAAAKKVEAYSFADQAPHVDRQAPKEMQAQKLERTVSMKRLIHEEQYFEPLDENNNDKILRLYKSGVSSIDIAKELGLGVGEVKLVINLFKGAI